GDDLVRQAFGAEIYARLQKIKRKYDPTNLFRMNQNIDPGTVATSGKIPIPQSVDDFSR
ncbi:MAG: hypothetical protein E6G89_06870, partial [Alphaproteobacteria bacterium]